MGGEGGGRTEDAQVFGVDTLSRAASCRDGAGSPCSLGPRSGCHHSSSLSVTCWRRVDESPCAPALQLNMIIIIVSQHRVVTMTRGSSAA